MKVQNGNVKLSRMSKCLKAVKIAVDRLKLLSTTLKFFQAVSGGLRRFLDIENFTKSEIFLKMDTEVRFSNYSRKKM